MTLSASAARSGPYAGNGSGTLFDYSFKILSASDLAVILTDTAGNESTLPGTAYSVHGVGDTNGGQVEMLIPPATGERITILRGAAFAQNTKYVNQSAFRPETIESSLDRLVMADQQLAEQLGRAIVVPPSSSESPDALAERVVGMADDLVQFGTVYLGAKITDPLLDNNDGVLVNGALYFNVTTAKFRVFDTSTGSWRDMDANSQQIVSTSSSITLEQHGAAGDGVTDDSAAWNAAVADAHTSGKSILLANRTYLIPGATTQTLTSHVTILGVGAPTLDGVNGAPTLFKPVTAGITFRNVSTKKLCLIESDNEVTGNIGLLDIRNWTYENTDQFTIRLRLKYEDHPFHVEQLILRDIKGKGGLGGPCFSAALINVDVDGYNVRDISVPDDDAHFEEDGHMINTGYGDGLLLGEDDPVAQSLCESWSIGRLSVSNIHDHRLRRKEDQAASCDGARLLGRGMSIGHIDAREIATESNEDVTAVYFKGWDSVIGSIYAENCGSYEACVVIKGARRRTGTRAKGFSVSVGSIKLFANDGAQRSGLYLGPDDIDIGFLSIEGLGGDVEYSHRPGERMSGSGPLVYCENTEKNRLSIRGYSIKNCDMGTIIPEPKLVPGDNPGDPPYLKQGRGSVRLFTLQGYREIYIGPGFIDNVSNSKLFSDQVPQSDPPPEANILAFHWGEKNYPAKSLVIDSVVATNFHAANEADVRLLTVSGRVDIDNVVLRAPIVDDTIKVGVSLGHQIDPIEDVGVPLPTIGSVQVVGGDLSACEKPYSAGLPPQKKRFNGCIGLLDDKVFTANLLPVVPEVPEGDPEPDGVPQTVAPGDNDIIEYLATEASEDWDDATHMFRPPEAGDYLIGVTLGIRPDAQSDFGATLELIKIANYNPQPPAPDPGDPHEHLGQVIKIDRERMGLQAALTAGAMKTSVRAFRVIRATPDDRIFARFSHSHDQPVPIAYDGGGPESFIQIWRLA